ncbi:hypothetical protein H4219_001495 [Mycoemilia scoparia]|uniref:Uncharacterized protein n=1 Tax=Mycoemilia scoparia TaxID=417184 RepID=A0A9W7ZZY9_9FUNG|nr:hypothetical protein H4219_001495 [Mycoemilia scoparia]
MKEKNKLKKAIQQGNEEGAQIYAENVIRKKTEALQLLKLSSRIDGVASQVQSAANRQQVMKAMGTAVRGIDNALKTMNVEKLTAITDQFQTQAEDVNVQTQYMQEAMGGAVTTMVPQDEMDLLKRQVADEAGIELKHKLGEAVAPQEESEDEMLTERLAKLRNA